MMQPYQKILGKDPVLKPLLAEPLVPVPAVKHLHLALINSILGQQLSVKVAAVIRARFYTLFPMPDPGPEAILAISDSELKSIGLSRQKTQYVYEVARFWKTYGLTDEKLQSSHPEEVITLLTEIKGVGRWTVEMLLMFGMGQEDVFAPDDLGIQKAMAALYEWKNLPKKELMLKMKEQAEAWKPYRSYACRHLWQWKDA